MRTNVIKWLLYERVIWPSRVHKAIIAVSIIVLVSLFLVCGSFIYFLSNYIGMYIHANQGVRSLLISADTDETKVALQEIDAQIDAIFPADNRLFFVSTNILNDESSASSEESVLYAANAKSVPMLKSGDSLSFTENIYELLIPSEFVGKAGGISTNELIGKDILITYPIYNIAAEQTGCGSIACTIVGTYDSHRTITTPPNGFFVSEQLIEELRDRSGISAIDLAERAFGVSPQTVVIAETVSVLPKIKSALTSQGFNVMPLFQWDVFSIGMLFSIAGIMCIISSLLSVILTNKMWFRLLHTQMRELQILYALGFQKTDLAKLLVSHYMTLLASTVIVILPVAQLILQHVGRSLMEDVISTTVFNPVTLISLMICSGYSIWVIRHYIKKLNSLDGKIS